MSFNPQNSAPGSLQAISILQLIGGIWAGLAALIVIGSFFLFTLSTFGLGLLSGPLWLIPILIWGAASILSLIAGLGGLGRNSTYGSHLGSCVMLMVCILFCDVIGFLLGLIALILLLQSDVKAYFNR